MDFHFSSKVLDIPPEAVNAMNFLEEYIYQSRLPRKVSLFIQVPALRFNAVLMTEITP